MAKNSAFGKAFAAARKAGKKNFTWEGKSFTTKTKEEAAAPVPKPRPKREAKAPVKGLRLPTNAKKLKGSPGKNKDTSSMGGVFAGKAKRDKKKSMSTNVEMAK